MNIVRSTVLLAAVLVAASPVRAQSQAEMNITAGKEVLRTDAELNAVYNRILTALANVPLGVVKMKTAERAWIAYRDAYLEANFPADDKFMNYGSMYPMSYDYLRVQVTRTHLTELKAMLKDLLEAK